MTMHQTFFKFFFSNVDDWFIDHRTIRFFISSFFSNFHSIRHSFERFRRFDHNLNAKNQNEMFFIDSSNSNVIFLFASSCVYFVNELNYKFLKFLIWKLFNIFVFTNIDFVSTIQTMKFSFQSSSSKKCQSSQIHFW